MESFAIMKRKGVGTLGEPYQTRLDPALAEPSRFQPEPTRPDSAKPPEDS
jgi:hypothetical protein